MGQRNEAEVGGDTRDIRLAGSMSVMGMLRQSDGYNPQDGLDCERPTVTYPDLFASKARSPWHQ